MLSDIAQRCVQFLRQSRRVHVRQDEVRSLRDAVAIVDRFILGSLEYPLQWDDFISWAHPNPTIERMRDEIADLEPDFLGESADKRTQALNTAIAIRDRYAAMIGIGPLAR